MTDQLQQLAREVEKMRYFQKEYIRTRDKYDLMDAKRMERNVDSLLDQLKNAGAFLVITITFFITASLW